MHKNKGVELVAEQKTRFYLFKVEGELPYELIKACRAYDESRDDCYELHTIRDERCRVYDEARRILNEALIKSISIVEALPAGIEYPNCPWCGKTIPLHRASFGED